MELTIPTLNIHLIDGTLTDKGAETFIDLIYDYYQQHKRDFAWRATDDPYHIVVSEIMLQQTQTDRVVEKYEQFIRMFPTVADLAQAPLGVVLEVWIGLGYNRRAMALHQFAQRVMSEFNGVIPSDPEVLVTFKGIGPNTAGSICAFAYNIPTVFIETNIRSVFIYLFFAGREQVADMEIVPLIARTVDAKNARHWYYALMDYGVMLKKRFKNPSRKSKHHARQSKFEGSDRQIRGKILRLLVEYKMVSFDVLNEQLGYDSRFARILEDLLQEKLVVQHNDYYRLPS